MILTDGVHLMSDGSLAELHEFALRMGMRRGWFQEHPLHPHYDLTTPAALARALRLGAKLVSGKELVTSYWGKGRDRC